MRDTQFHAGKNACYSGCHSRVRKLMELVDGIDAGALTADKAYDTDAVIDQTFRRLKKCRVIATRYAKNTASFLAAVRLGVLRFG